MTGHRCSLNNRKIYHLALDGVLPVRRRNNRWECYRNEFGTVIEVIQHLDPHDAPEQNMPAAMVAA